VSDEEKAKAVHAALWPHPMEDRNRQWLIDALPRLAEIFREPVRITEAQVNEAVEAFGRLAGRAMNAEEWRRFAATVRGIFEVIGVFEPEPTPGEKFVDRVNARLRADDVGWLTDLSAKRVAEEYDKAIAEAKEGRG